MTHMPINHHLSGLSGFFYSHLSNQLITVLASAQMLGALGMSERCFCFGAFYLICEWSVQGADRKWVERNGGCKKSTAQDSNSKYEPILDEWETASYNITLITIYHCGFVWYSTHANTHMFLALFALRGLERNAPIVWYCFLPPDKNIGTHLWWTWTMGLGPPARPAFQI